MSNEQIFAIDSTFLPALRDSQEQIVTPLPKELEELSWREIEILRCLAMGHPNKTIAHQLGIAETTVKAHVKTILRKTKALNRSQAAMWSMNHEIRTLDMAYSSNSGLSARSRNQPAGATPLSTPIEA